MNLQVRMKLEDRKKSSIRSNEVMQYEEKYVL